MEPQIVVACVNCDFFLCHGGEGPEGLCYVGSPILTQIVDASDYWCSHFKLSNTPYLYATRETNDDDANRPASPADTQSGERAKDDGRGDGRANRGDGKRPWYGSLKPYEPREGSR